MAQKTTRRKVMVKAAAASARMHFYWVLRRKFACQTAGDVRCIAALSRDGHTVSEIARKVAVARSTVRFWINRANATGTRLRAL